MNFNDKNKLSSVAIAVASALVLSACGSSDDDTPAVEIPVTPVVTNSAPTDIMLSATTVVENAVAAVIGELSATDADAGETFVFTTTSELFDINGTSLVLKDGVSFDYEEATTADVTVTVTDGAGNALDKSFTIEVGDVLDYYSFPSKLIDGDDSVAYSGQVARQLLINELNNFVNSYFGDVNTFNAESTFDAVDLESDVMAQLNSYYSPDDALYAEISERPLTTSTVVAGKQTKLSEISSSTKNLIGKIAGKDPKSQHKDWNTEFAGWGATGSITPDELIQYFFQQLADNAEVAQSGGLRNNVLGDAITKVYLTDNGVDLKQMIQKVLLMTVAFSQGADDYLDLDLVDPTSSGKGIDASNDQDGSKPYTKLEHQIDEGFGYFGAARGYLSYSDDEIKAAKTGLDHNGDEMLDFQSEFNFGQSVNASKRDIGSANVYDFSATAFNHFLAARQLANDLAGRAGAPTVSERQEIFAHTKLAVEAWEHSIASSTVHYINESLIKLELLGTSDFDYVLLAKYWSEMKAFGLGLQFNRHSPLSDERFEQFHTLVGNNPVLVGEEEIAAYKQALLDARLILQDAYQYDADLVAIW